MTPIERIVGTVAGILFGMALGILIVTIAEADEPVTCTASLAGDGDTFYCAGAEVRVLSIDTPEDGPWVNNKGVTKPAECYGFKATKERRRLTELGPVTLTGDGIDGHGRLLRYVTLADGRDLGEVLIAGGYAALYKGVSATDPDYLRYAPWQAVAQVSGFGMWGACSNPPGHNGQVVS